MRLFAAAWRCFDVLILSRPDGKRSGMAISKRMLLPTTQVARSFDAHSSCAGGGAAAAGWDKGCLVARMIRPKREEAGQKEEKSKDDLRQASAEEWRRTALVDSLMPQELDFIETSPILTHPSRLDGN